MDETTEKLREANAMLKQRLLEQDALLRALAEPPLTYATVLRLVPGESRAVLVAGSEVVEAAVPPGVGLSPGDVVRISNKTGGIVGIAPRGKEVGAVVTVGRVVTGMLECEVAGERRLLQPGAGVSAKAGDLVVVDRTGFFAVATVAKPEPPPPDRSTLVSWDDVGGLDEAKKALREAIEGPARHPELYARYGRRPTRGVMLYGPPGCGKTLLGKAAATALARAHGKRDAVGFFYVKGPEVLSMWVGNSESNVRQLFAGAREHKARHGYPAVIFVDEADAILSRRGSGSAGDMERTIVPAFLAEMDGIGDSGAVVLLATNRQDTLDPAVVRDGRVDRRIRISRPTQKDAAEIFGVHLAGKPGYDPALAERAAASLYADELALWSVVDRSGAAHAFRLGDLASGAMIAGVCDRAATSAMDREIRSDRRQKITAADVDGAVRQTLDEVRDVDHGDAIAEFVEARGIEVAGIRKVRRGEAATLAA